MFDTFKYEVSSRKNIDNDKIPISNGRLLVCNDSLELFFDSNDARKQIGQIISVKNDAELRSIPNYIKGKFYYVQDPTPKLLFYDGVKFLGGTNTYIHPTYSVIDGTYRKVTINKQGHVTGASNDIMEISEGGTGCDNLEDFINKLQVPNLNQFNEVNERLSYFTKEYGISDWVEKTTKYCIEIKQDTHNVIINDGIIPIIDVYIYDESDGYYKLKYGIVDEYDYTVYIDNNNSVIIESSNTFKFRIIVRRV